MKKKAIAVLFLSILLIVFTGCGTTSSVSSGKASSKSSGSNNATSSSSGKKVTLKLGYGGTTTNPRNTAAEKFASLVKQYTNGQVQVNLFPNEQLGSEPEMISEVSSGTLDMALAGASVFGSNDARMGAINLPYIFTSYKAAYSVLDGPVGQEVAQPLSKENIHLIAYWENGFREITNSKRPINTPSDLQGLKLRVPQSPMSLATFKALGTNPTPMAFGQLYTALQSHTVDGQENPLTNIWASNFFEVQKYLSLTNHQYDALPLVINQKEWDAFPKNIQDAITKAADQARDLHRQLVQKQADSLVSQLEAKGMKVNTPNLSPFKEATKDVYKEFTSQMGSQFLQDFQAAAQKADQKYPSNN